ncbi:phosphotransferase [Streptomyces sp. NPDC048191]|uniref:phosphotransferase n=1 Tax=Streptomyces sp. NPDC048191 TaxID=3155484 RepID=UPI00340CBD7A
MTGPRQHKTVADLAPLARAALGRHRTLGAVTRLRGGSKKGVYRLHLDDGGTVIAYVWSADEDYWDQPEADLRDPFSHASGLDLFTAAHERLAAVGVRTPRLLHTDPAVSAAVVEDLPGGSLEDVLRRDPDAAGPALRELARALRALHGCRSAGPGKVALVEAGGTSYGASCARLVTDRALSTSPRPPYATRVPPPGGRGWRRPCAPWPPGSARAPTTSSSMANWARTTSCWTRTAVPP